MKQDNKEKFEAILLDIYNEGYSPAFTSARIETILPNEEIRNAVMLGMERARQWGANESKWISVDDRLPPLNEPFHAFQYGKIVYGMGAFTGIWDEEFRRGHMKIIGITHWHAVLSPPQLPAQSDTEPVEAWCIYLDVNDTDKKAISITEFANKLCPEILLDVNHYFGILNGKYQLSKEPFAPVIKFKEFFTIKNKTV